MRNRPDLMRFSIGIAHIEDILANLDQALDLATAHSRSVLTRQRVNASITR